MQELLNTSKSMHVNPNAKKINRWLEGTRLQLPFAITTVDSNGIIASINNVVKNDEKYSTKYSIEVDEDGIENYIISGETKSLPYSERKKKLLNKIETLLRRQMNKPLSIRPKRHGKQFL